MRSRSCSEAVLAWFDHRQVPVRKPYIYHSHSEALTVSLMGNIRPTYIKRVAIELVQKYPEQFTSDFQHNKIMVSKLTDVRFVSMRNKIAGYVTRYRTHYEA